jgi:hypothetical protein
MGYGGTNWGFWNGANGGGSSFQPVITSYDYDSPVQEGGGHGYGPDGDKFRALQQLLTYAAGGGLPAEPPAPAVTAYGAVSMTQAAGLWPNLAALAGTAGIADTITRPVEYYGQRHGYVVYRTAVPPGHDGTAVPLVITGLADRGEVGRRGGRDAGHPRREHGPHQLRARVL